MSGAPALELQGITREFGRVIALQDASLVVREGTVHALLGENGAGKTTLMRIAYGILRPGAGRLVIGGMPHQLASPADAIAAGIGMVQQHPTNVPALTVWENVLLGGAGVLDPRAARTEVRSLTDQLGFALDPDGVVGELPVAAQQRVEILKAAYRKARLLILDEPTAILAPEEATELYAWLRAFADRGGTVIVVTHKLDEARRFTDDLTVLRAGRTVLQAPSGSVSSEHLTMAMIGEALPGAAKRESVLAGDVVVRVDHLSLRDDRRVAVIRGATFDVCAGEILGVAGVEGSGHHQLLLALAGRITPGEGSIQTPERVSFIPEDRHRDGVVLPFSLTENAAIKNAGMRQGRIGWERLAAQVADLMTRFDVRASAPDAVMRTLSGGNQQKFVLGRELEGEPDLVVAENPTRGLDIRAAAFVREQLRLARDRGAAVVVYSSDLDEILDLAERILVVHRGSVSVAPHDRTRIGAAMLGAA